jgi:hypothetical protein
MAIFNSYVCLPEGRCIRLPESIRQFKRDYEKGGTMKKRDYEKRDYEKREIGQL